MTAVVLPKKDKNEGETILKRIPAKSPYIETS